MTATATGLAALAMEDLRSALAQSETLQELFGSLADNISIVMAKDGSGVGAALCALVAQPVDGQIPS